jgi:nitrite reductase (NADH) large subunit
MQELEWKTSCGCAKCRPALNYYLVADWPDEYADDYQSRFVNERVHANIQKDGTYSVVPRMWGGMTSSAELRAIADVVDKFAIPAVKVTGGQRIDMLGIRKEDLPAVWADLGEAGFVSGQAYAKGLRTVKTCVGSDWCRFGTQDSTGSASIEKFMWGSWTPAKVKMAVSGCPRNCAEATCKDVGVICVEAGFEIHFAGAAGLDIKGTEMLGSVETEDEAIEVIVALVAALSRAGALSGAHLQMGQTRRHRQIRGRCSTISIAASALRPLRLQPEIRAIDPWSRACVRADKPTSSSRWRTFLAEAAE